MKRSTRDMTRDELEEFLKMSPLEVYEAALKYRPGERRRAFVIGISNMLILLGSSRAMIASLHENTLEPWMWLVLLYLVISTSLLILSLPSSSKARQLCEEQDEILESRKRRRL